MKKLTLIALFISLFQVINAQEVEVDDNFILGGSINFLIQNNALYSISTADRKNTGFSISPYFGKEINPRLILGILLDYDVGKSTWQNTPFGQQDLVNYERNANQFGIGIFTRHTINPDQQFSFFIQPSLAYNRSIGKFLEDSNLVEEEKTTFIELGIGAGLLYDINDRLRLTLRMGGISYVNGNWEIVDSETEENFNSFRTNFSLSSVFFGLEIKI